MSTIKAPERKVNNPSIIWSQLAAPRSMNPPRQPLLFYCVTSRGILPGERRRKPDTRWDGRGPRGFATATSHHLLAPAPLVSSLRRRRRVRLVAVAAPIAAQKYRLLFLLATAMAAPRCAPPAWVKSFHTSVALDNGLAQSFWGKRNLLSEWKRHGATKGSKHFPFGTSRGSYLGIQRSVRPVERLKIPLDWDQNLFQRKGPLTAVFVISDIQ